MDRKKELKQIYKEMPIEGGVYQIKNNQNGKVFIGSTRNFKTLNGLKFSLEAGTASPTNKELQEDWSYYGADIFSIDILETLKKKDDPYFNEKEALVELEDKWLEQLQPYEESGYNKKKKV
ncbi:GIY-YIG nuclease family protein [Schinkia azotoformans]|nr:GIY-YIG nuclease family protein [Schinkia azotoformans]MEC1640747.1 GIY-YIG nuclease family protein [Schinkia azotoformans]MEC1696646.1 GIY-YIG nuclease family protein [Schinkia azotoformans]MEC1715648.1 GIY-YIG nuclease family protein [Schinkia azotoformans]MEC1720225.1 GIY-YIG nuclease family protein [Schinkia azotoformans]MEC1726120.1 GIY-YIG nuclease family protein [Schinkia azotoformans]